MEEDGCPIMAGGKERDGERSERNRSGQEAKKKGLRWGWGTKWQREEEKLREVCREKSRKRGGRGKGRAGVRNKLTLRKK